MIRVTGGAAPGIVCALVPVFFRILIDALLQVLFIGLVLLTLGNMGSCAGAIAGKCRI